MKRAGALFGRVEELREQAKQRAEREKRDPLPGAPLPKNVVQLPLWPEPVRAVPNGFLRSALFGAIAKGRRRYINGEDLAAVDGVTIRYKGERLDQGDLDVWESVLHAVRLQELGSTCRVTSYALLKLMGKTDTGKNRATLNKRITRLVASALTVKQGRYSYIGSLIAGAAKDEETQEWVIELDAKLRPLFAADQFTQVEWPCATSWTGSRSRSGCTASTPATPHRSRSRSKRCTGSAVARRARCGSSPRRCARRWTTWQRPAQPTARGSAPTFAATSCMSRRRPKGRSGGTWPRRPASPGSLALDTVPAGRRYRSSR